MKKLHYFDEGVADSQDIQLQMCIGQGYVPKTCLLAGAVVWSEMAQSRDPCAGCEGPREICHGRRRAVEETWPPIKPWRRRAGSNEQ